jgi:hypothetical protein
MAANLALENLLHAALEAAGTAPWGAISTPT